MRGVRKTRLPAAGSTSNDVRQSSAWASTDGVHHSAHSRVAAFPNADSAAPSEERAQRSLFGEILDWMLVPLLLLWPISIAFTYVVAKSIANQPFDKALEDKVTVLAQQVKLHDDRITVQLPAQARDMLRADEVDQLFFQIAGPDGEIIAGESTMPQLQADEVAQPWSVHLRNGTMRNTELRIAYTYVDLNLHVNRQRMPMEDALPPRLVLVQVGETLEKRKNLANQIIKGVILPEFIILPIALALVWFALARGLSPLAELQQHIRARRVDDLSPIDWHRVPEEISPLVRSLNDMLERLSQNIAMQKRFIADAAHQMKTPLAGMRMQSELALRETSQAEIHRSLEQLLKSSQSATRLINQLLALAHAENHMPSIAPMELGELSRSAVQDWVQVSFARKIDLGFEQPGYPVMVMGNPTMLRELLNNLIDNALRYTPAGGKVTVRIQADDSRRHALLEVEDTGPGIPLSERAHVFERFYRILGSQVDGSGLGLAIVREIAQQHEASIDILDNPRSQDPQHPGCLFRVTMALRRRSALIDDIG
jgi:two-component system, OmpR family, sensor histidine kinase TctE